MTAQEAHKILHPDTSRDEIMKIEYYAGFRAEEAGLKAVQEACLVACEALEKQISLERIIERIVERIEEEILEKLSDGGDDWFEAEMINKAIKIVREEGGMNE